MFLRRGSRHSLISIHAPREGGDVILWPLCLPLWAFQSTPPARGATRILVFIRVIKMISIHAPREGGDQNGRTIKKLSSLFQSTPPARGATWFDSSSRNQF